MRPSDEIRAWRQRDGRASRQDGADQGGEGPALRHQDQEKGLLIVHTGTGKGKSTAAWGLAMRCLGHGLKLGVVQFVKGRSVPGERLFLERFPSWSRSR